MKNLNTILEKIYNTLGNKYLTDNFDTEPFEFKVKLRKGNTDAAFEFLDRYKKTISIIERTSAALGKKVVYKTTSGSSINGNLNLNSIGTTHLHPIKIESLGTREQYILSSGKYNEKIFNEIMK